MKIKKEHHIESEGTLGCERLKTDKHSSGKVIYIPIVTFSDNVENYLTNSENSFIFQFLSLQMTTQNMTI